MVVLRGSWFAGASVWLECLDGSSLASAVAGEARTLLVFIEGGRGVVEQDAVVRPLRVGSLVVHGPSMAVRSVDLRGWLLGVDSAGSQVVGGELVEAARGLAAGVYRLGIEDQRRCRMLLEALAYELAVGPDEGGALSRCWGWFWAVVFGPRTACRPLRRA